MDAGTRAPTTGTRTVYLAGGHHQVPEFMNQAQWAWLRLMNTGDLDMNSLCKILSRAFAATTLLLVSEGALQAGGLVDTSLERFLDADFNDSANITNPWWTLPAGSNFLYFAEADGECEWNLIEVLNATTDNFGSDYAGTEARIVLDRAWLDEECEFEGDPANFAAVVAKVGDPEETTYDWFAQDDDGNIWYMGEDTFSDGSSEGSFTAGCDGAEAGIVMLADPQNGDFYRQEFFAGEAEDWGKVTTFIDADELVCLKTKEWSPLETGHIEHKFYCSDGDTGVLAWIDELKGKTVTVVLIDTGVDAPDPPNGPPNPIPADCD
jgi:hypothetical protein